MKMDTARVAIRLADERDAQAIAVLLRSAFAEFESLYTADAFKATTPNVDEVTARFTEGPIWIAELDRVIVGTVSTVAHGWELYIRSMAVHPTARGSGVGAQLLDPVEGFAAEHRYRRLVLNTTPFLSSAIRLYQKYGFGYTGEKPNLFGTPLLTMSKDLKSD